MTAAIRVLVGVTAVASVWYAGTILAGRPEAVDTVVAGPAGTPPDTSVAGGSLTRGQALRPALPAWFDSARVQGHTRLGLGPRTDTAAYRNAPVRFLGLGLRVFTRHFKSASGSPFTVMAPGDDVRLGADSALIRSAFAEAHRAGQHTIAYVWISSDSAMETRHPDWVCRGPDGRTPVTMRRGDFLDITSPYRELVLRELEALAAQGADGFFFDASHMPAGGCWGSHLARAFEERTGQAPPKRRRARDPLYRAFLAFQAEQVEETLSWWRDRVHEEYPGVVFVTSVATLPTLMDPRFPTGLAGAGDVPKTEFESPVRPAFGGWMPGGDSVPRGVRIAAGWTLVRDAAGGRPPVVWALGFADSARAEAFVAAVLTHGGTASLDVADAIMAGRAVAPHATPVSALKDAAALGDRVAPGLAGTHPQAWAGIHFPEAARDRLMGDPDHAWNRAVLPALRAFEALLWQRVPFRWVTDHALAAGEIEDLRVLVLPDSADLTTAQAERVAAFRRRGGRVVTIGDPGSPNERLGAELPGVPIRVLGGPATLHVGFFTTADDARTTVLLTPDFSWVQPLALRERPRSEAPMPSQVSGVLVKLTPGSYSAPPRARELVTGVDLPVTRAADGGYEIHLPSFRILAAVLLRR